jgi:hypothetical protein
MPRLTTALVCLLLCNPAARAGEPALTDHDRRFLDGLFRDFLFDPTGTERVRVQATVYDGGRPVLAACDGWLVKGEGGTSRVVFTDGSAIPAPAAVTKVDFVAACTRRYPAKQPAAGAPDPARELLDRRDRRLAIGRESDLALAAWLHRLGNDGLAARALAAARDEYGNAAVVNRQTRKPGPVEEFARDVLRGDLARTAFQGLVHSFARRADADALAHGERLLRLYPDAAADDYPQARQIVADLKRRKDARRPARPSPINAPGEIIPILIDALDEADPGSFPLNDWRARALIDVGDAAVPALIDAIEKDTRLTRHVESFPNGSGVVLSVREVALGTVKSILQVYWIYEVPSGQRFTTSGEPAAKEAAARLRAYWAEYGKFPFDERMMRALTNPKSSDRACQQSAFDLARLGLDDKARDDLRWKFGFVTRDPHQPNPAVAKFTNPTTAEAVLARMDRELARLPANPPRRQRGFPLFVPSEDTGPSRHEVLSGYLRPLTILGDTRIGSELARRARAATASEVRWEYALAAVHLGEKEPVREIAREVAAGTLKLPGNPATDGLDDPAADELEDVIRLLVDLDTPEANMALHALADPKHPFRRLVVLTTQADEPIIGGYRGLRGHPAGLTLYWQLLDDTTPTGWRYVVESGIVFEYRPSGGGSNQFLDPKERVADPTRRKAKAAVRACDRAMERLTAIAGMPEFHPLLNDADDRIRDGRALMDRFVGRIRELSRDEHLLFTGDRHDLFGRRNGPSYVFDIRPLGRPATAADVAAGRAVFHLDGKGRVAGTTLPAWCVLTVDAGDKHPPRGLVVQAEVGADGATTYGVIFEHAMRAVPAAEVEKVEENPKPPQRAR